MRVFLLGTLSAILLALLIGAGWVVTSRRARLAPPAAEVADEEVPEPSAARPEARRREPLPAVGAAGCTPRPGWACWRGRLLLGAGALRDWRARRAKAQASGDDEGTVQGWVEARVEGRVEDPVEDPGEVPFEDRPQPGHHPDPALPAVNAGESDVSEADGDPVTAPDVSLPPDGPFPGMFELRVYRTRDPDGTPRASGDEDDAQGGDEEVSSIRLWDDGSFEVHVPPGRYGLEAVSRDGFVAGGRDELRAVAGDAQDGLEVVLGRTVALAGRVVDDDDLLVPATLSVARVADSTSVTITQTDGDFQFERLRPGPYRVTAEGADGQTTAATFVAPLEGVALHLTRPRAGLLLLPPGSDGRCPRGVVSLTPHHPDSPSPDGPNAPSLREALPSRQAHLIDCYAVIDAIAPGTAWDVVTTLGAIVSKTRVQFGFESPLAPVCLSSGCAAAAVLELATVDLDGQLMSRDATVTASPPGGPEVGSVIHARSAGLPANQSITVEIAAGTSTITRQIWLRPGVNREVVRLPVHAADIDDGEVLILD